MGISYKRTPKGSGLLCLGSFTWHNALEAHPCSSRKQKFITFHPSMLFHWMATEYSVYHSPADRLLGCSTIWRLQTVLLWKTCKDEYLCGHRFHFFLLIILQFDFLFCPLHRLDPSVQDIDWVTVLSHTKCCALQELIEDTAVYLVPSTCQVMGARCFIIRSRLHSLCYNYILVSYFILMEWG